MENEDSSKAESSHEKAWEHKEKTHVKKKKHSEQTLTDMLRDKPLVVSTIVLGVLVLILLINNFGGFTGKSISEDAAGQAFVTYLRQAGADVNSVEITDISSDKGLYRISFDYQGQAYPVSYYMTKDGSLIGAMTELEDSSSSPQSSESAEVPQSDTPVVELFIWGYCPYGVQAQGPLAEVASLLRDYADFKAVLYYDGHGAFETQENKIQECIQKVAPEKYWDYAVGFVEDIYPKCSSERTEACDKTESVKLMNSLGINSNSVLSCVNSEGAGLISEASARAKEVSVTGSPSLVINGVKVSTARNAEAFKTAVCEAFTDGNAPSECDEVLSSASAAASGNC